VAIQGRVTNAGRAALDRHGAARLAMTKSMGFDPIPKKYP